MIEDVWMGHSGIVRSLSWSPSGNHLASGSQDGTIVIRKVENGEIEVGPIESKQNLVLVVAYSPFGDKIASGGGRNNTICVWNKTGQLLLQLKISEYVASVVWSLDSAKLYCSSDNPAYVFDSSSGEELYCFEHENPLHSIALSPTHNLLACVGLEGIARLWDTESHQPLSSQPFGLEDRVDVTCVSFSRDGRYLAYGGANKLITLWTMKEIVGTEQGAQQGHTEIQSQSSSCLDFDATKPLARSCNDITEDGHDDLYSNFFQGSKPYLPETSSIRPQFPYLSLARRFWNVRITSRHFPQQTSPFHKNTPSAVSLHVDLTQTRTCSSQLPLPTNCFQK